MAKIELLCFRGSSHRDLCTFPIFARREAGFQLDQIQQGLDADDWKPMKTIGAGVREIRISDSAGIFRIVYIAKFSDAIYVLHCFQKKSEKTSKLDLDVAEKRYSDLIKELSK